MDQTTHLGLPYLASSQARKHVTPNESLTSLDALVQASVHSRSDALPPSPAAGASYILASDEAGVATGDLACHDGYGWQILRAGEGWRA